MAQHVAQLWLSFTEWQSLEAMFQGVWFLPAAVSPSSSSTTLVTEEKHSLPWAIKLKPQTDLFLSVFNVAPVSCVFYRLGLALSRATEMKWKREWSVFLYIWAETGIFCETGEGPKCTISFMRSSAKVSEKHNRVFRKPLTYIDYITHFLSRVHTSLCGENLFLHL